MNLTFTKVYPIASICKKEFDINAADAVLVTIVIETPSQILDSRPYHWMYDFKDNLPPLDIALDSESGLLKEITIFIDDNDITMDIPIDTSDLNVVTGYPSFSTNMWKEDEYYFDTSGSLDIQLYQADLQILVSDSIVTKKVEVNDGLDILLDSNEMVTGFILHGINDKYRKLLLKSEV